MIQKAFIFIAIWLGVVVGGVGVLGLFVRVAILGSGWGIFALYGVLFFIIVTMLTACIYSNIS